MYSNSNTEFQIIQIWIHSIGFYLNTNTKASWKYPWIFFTEKYLLSVTGWRTVLNLCNTKMSSRTHIQHPHWQVAAESDPNHAIQSANPVPNKTMTHLPSRRLLCRIWILFSCIWIQKEIFLYLSLFIWRQIHPNAVFE